MHLKNTITATSRLMFDQKARCCTLAKWTHKINYHRHQKSITVCGPERGPGSLEKKESGQL